MNIPNISIKQLLEAGVHLGHKTLRWNPKMEKFIFGEKNSIHIIDLTKTVSLIKNAMKEVHKCISVGGKILIVSTKKQATETVLKLAKETDQFYVNYVVIHLQHTHDFDELISFGSESLLFLMQC